MLSVIFLEDMALIADAASSIGPALAGRFRGRSLDTAEAAGAAVVEGADAIDHVADDWQALDRDAGAATPFQSFAVARAAAEVHLRRGEVPRIAVVRHAGRPVVILPTVVRTSCGVKVARFLGDPLIQYGDALCEPGTARRHLEAALRAVADPGAVDALHLRKVRADARLAPLLRRCADAFNHDEAPFLHIGDQAPAEESRQLRRSRKKLLAVGPLELDVIRGEPARRYLRETLSIKRCWLDSRRLPSSVIGDDDWEHALAQIAAADDSLHVVVLRAGGRPAAYEVALTGGDHWHSFIGAVAEDFARHGPGRVQVADTIAWCRANGFTRYDALAPTDEAKRGYCCSATAVADYTLALRPRGHVLAAALRLMPVAKSMVLRLPAPLRSLVMAMARR